MTRFLRRTWRYVLNVLIAIDQLGNALVGGDPDETLSSQVGKWMRRGEHGDKGALYWRWRAFRDFIERIGLFPRSHWEEAIEPDEGRPPLPPVTVQPQADKVTVTVRLDQEWKEPKA